MAAVAFGGCGYGFAGGTGVERAAPGRAVEVVPFDNRSFEPDAALLATRSAARAATRAGSGPAAILTGTVESLEVVAAAPARPQRVEMWRVDGRLRVELREGAGAAATVLARGAAQGSEQFRPGANTVETEVQRRMATERLLERLVAEAISALK